MQLVLSTEIVYEDIATTLRAGGVIVYPTDTAYALGCDATNEQAVKKIFEIKNRDIHNTVPLIAGSIAMVDSFFVAENKARELMLAHWPGPLTLILPLKNDCIASYARRDNCSAVRVPDSIIACAISHAIGVPIISTSANHSADGECYSVDEVRVSLGGQYADVSMVIDAGTLPKKAPSTIARCEDEEVEVLRHGSIQLV